MLILCPSCHRDLDEIIFHGVSAHTCSLCASIWLPRAAMQEIIDAARRGRVSPVIAVLGQTEEVSIYETRVASRIRPAGPEVQSAETTSGLGR